MYTSTCVQSDMQIGSDGHHTLFVCQYINQYLLVGSVYDVYTHAHIINLTS